MLFSSLKKKKHKHSYTSYTYTYAMTNFLFHSRNSWIPVLASHSTKKRNSRLSSLCKQTNFRIFSATSLQRIFVNSIYILIICAVRTWHSYTNSSFVHRSVVAMSLSSWVIFLNSKNAADKTRQDKIRRIHDIC